MCVCVRVSKCFYEWDRAIVRVRPDECASENVWVRVSVCECVCEYVRECSRQCARARVNASECESACECECARE